VVANPVSADTWTRYDEAPAEAFHVSVGFVATPVAPLAGLANTGAAGMGGGAAAVVKLHGDEYALVPPPLLALTRQ
jgi:hypothetical protein